MEDILLKQYYNPSPKILSASSIINLLTPNQSTGTDTLGDTTGFFTYNSATLSSTTEQFHSGSRSLKVVTGGAGSYEGTYFYATALTIGSRYVVGFWFKGSNGVTFNVREPDNSTWSSFTATGDWQFIEKSGITPDMVVYVYIGTANTQVTTFYIDDCVFGLV